MTVNRDILRNEVRHLAEEAFHRKLISGYGDGADIKEYQIVFQGKPRHFPLEEAHTFLANLLFSDQNNENISFDELVSHTDTKNQDLT